MIPAFDFRSGYERHRTEFDAAMARVLASGQLILGPEVRAFEEEFAGYVGVALGVGVASGTDALTLALRALGIGPGDEVITVANAGVPPVAAIRAAGATPRFADVHPDTLLLDPAGLEGACSERTRCILPVHLYGHPVEMDAILDFARSRGLRVVEDCAQAHGARHRGVTVGSFGEIGCFSFYPTKNLGAFGDAGMCVTDDPELAESLRMLRTYGFRDDQHAHREGLNSRLDELQAAILRVQLRHLDAAIESRRRLAARYLRRLDGAHYPHPCTVGPDSHAYHLFVVQVGERARVSEALARQEIGCGVHYPEPVHRMEAYRFLGYGEGDLPVSERACRSVLSLPLYPGLADAAVDQVTDVLNRLGRAHP